MNKNIEKMSVIKTKIQNILYIVIMFTIGFVLTSTILTIISNCTSIELYLKTNSYFSTTTDETVLEEADKNLEKIKNSTNSKISIEDKEELVEMLSNLSEKLHNYKGYKAENNYQYLNTVIPNTQEKVYVIGLDTMLKIKKIEKEINNIDDSEDYYIFDKYPVVKDNIKKLANCNYFQNQMRLDMLYPEYSFGNNLKLTIHTYYTQLHSQPYLNIDQVYLELTKIIIEVGGIYE